VRSLPAAVLFDMDGTLIDSEGLWLAAEIDLMSGLGSTWTQDDQRICLGGPLERVAAYMVDRADTDLTAQDIGQMLLSAVEVRMRESVLAWRPGARELLVEAHARSIPTALVSASWNLLIDAVSGKIQDDLGRVAFDVVVAGDDVTNSKPHPEPYQMAAARLGFAASACLALEDSPTGVASAVSAGCVVVAIPHLAAIPTEGAFVVRTLEKWTIDTLWAAARR
jgi:HAD superfamily hydrolase (TIGR01509 family)